MVDGLRVGGSSAIVIVTNTSGNGANGILGILISRGHTVMRNIRVMSGDAGPSTRGPRKNVMGRRTPVRVSGLDLVSPGDNGTAHITVGRRNGGIIHVTGGSKRRVGW